MSNNEQESYSQILKSTSLFGGVQVFNILISIVRSKFVAILIGPVGMGIYGLLTSTSAFLSALTSFGLGTSAVKNVSNVSSFGNETQISKVIVIIRRLTAITGFVGMILSAVLSPWLSKIVFGNKDYTLPFIWISITLLFQQLTSGNLVMLQGLRKLRYLATANVFGSIVGLFLTVPIYYFWRLEGIVPVIILNSLSSMVLSYYFAHKVEILSVKTTLNETIAESKDMLKMGFAISLSGIIAAAVSFIVRTYINKIGGVDQVGLYNAGFSLIGTYVGMIFTAMVTDYYPRLSAVSSDNMRCRELINQQAEVAILIISPLLAFFLVYISFIIIILYSGEFIPAQDMIYWAAIGMYFKAASWSVSIIMLAKGASKLYFWNELLANLYILIFNILGYILADLKGLGMSFLLAYIIYFFQVVILTKYKFDFHFNRIFYKIGGFQLLIGISCFIINRFISSPWSFIIGSIFILVSCSHSITELNKRMPIILTIKSQFSKFIRQ